MSDRRGMSRVDNYECKVYVGNLGDYGDKSELDRAFSKYGPVRSVWVAQRPTGFAFIEMEDARDAEDAVRALDGREICGQRVRVEMRKKERRNGGDDRDRRYFYLSKNFALSPKKFVVFLTRLFDFKILALVLLALR